MRGFGKTYFEVYLFCSWRGGLSPHDGRDWDLGGRDDKYNSETGRLGWKHGILCIQSRKLDNLTSSKCFRIRLAKRSLMSQCELSKLVNQISPH
jgi:hypothetical protein